MTRRNKFAEQTQLRTFFISFFQKAFEALLPNETIDAVRLTCINIVVQKCQMKTEEWKALNLVGIGKYFDFFKKFMPILKIHTIIGLYHYFRYFYQGHSRRC